MLNRLSLSWLLLILVPGAALAQTREEKVRGDRQRVEEEGYWIYNNLPKAFEQAKAEDKPIIVVLRCIPCEECVKLDDELMDNDPAVRPLLDKFVRARQVSTNGLDLNLFQYDTDQSFAVFLLNADGTIYGRFGTRSHETEWFGDVSLKGLASAMEGALLAHKNLPRVKSKLVAKRGKPLEFASPEKYPHLRDKFTDKLNYQGDVVKSCIHCHQIGDARRAYYRDQGKPIPDKLFFPYPHPKTIGLVMDPDVRGLVKSVTPDSPASSIGFQGGDTILTMNNQLILSIADMQWVLDGVESSGGTVSINFRRGYKNLTHELKLFEGWRNSDISWRVSSWPYRRMVTGGMRLEEASDDVREEYGLAESQMALHVKHVGQYGKHAVAKRAGFKKDDIIISYDGKTDLMTDSQLMHYGVNQCKVGERIDVVLLRGDQKKTFKLLIQE